MMRNLEKTHMRGEEALYCTDNPRIWKNGETSQLLQSAASDKGEA